MGKRSVSFAMGVAIALLAVAAAPAAAKPGQRDVKYGNFDFGLGVVSGDSFPDGLDQFVGLAVSRKGKAVLAGTTEVAGDDHFAVGRLTRSGKLDSSFGDPVDHVATGSISGDDRVNDVTVSADGSIFLAGGCSNVVTRICVAKLDPTGKLDPGFDGDGRQTTTIGADASGEAVALAKGGKVVVAGSADVGGKDELAVVRYRPDGLPDPSFNGGVITRAVGVDAQAFDVAVQKDGKVVAVGGDRNGSNDSEICVLRLRANGTPDPGFGKNGIVRIHAGKDSIALAVAIDRKGRVVLAGVNESSGSGTVARLTPRGKRDRGFGGGDGIANPSFGPRSDFLTDLVVQRSGRIVVAGFGGDIPTIPGGTLIGALSSNGSVDRRFARRGSSLFNLGVTGFSSVSIGRQPGGGILVGSAFRLFDPIDGMAVSRFSG